jgi:hypothetical protein
LPIGKVLDWGMTADSLTDRLGEHLQERLLGKAAVSLSC